MSSDRNSSVESLELSGRGHRKQKAIVRRIRQEHGTLILSLPEALGMKLNQEVTIERVHTNPLLWELRIKPNRTEKK
jgi:hypothetical protein